MNPSLPFPNPSFTFLSPNPTPNPNPNPNFSLSLPQHTPSPDLPKTLSMLNNLIHLSQQTIQSLSTLHLFNSPIILSQNDAAVLVPCPFNPHHRMPPESLFRHSLTCPSPLDSDPLLDSLRYPHTLKSSAESQKQNQFVQVLNNSDAELCFSFDDFGSNFYYSDCPGVVSSFSLDPDSAKRTFTLPGILSVECANFIGRGDSEIKAFGRGCLKLLASELWAIRGEIEIWNDYPNLYSYSVLRAILCAGMVKEIDLMRWVIANSPRYGVVIDVAMRDHIFFLFRLCLKGIVREAFGLMEVVINREVKEQNWEMGSRFKCPVLVQVLKWLATQLSVLYGDVNGKIFAINMFKQCILSAALCHLLFSLEQNVTESPTLKEGSPILDAEVGVADNVKHEEPIEKSTENETIFSRKFFVSQVAAAVAALHERSLLEDKIKRLRLSRPVTKYQIMTEHAYVSKRAEEERQKRSNYRPLLEHDGLLWQRSHSQEMNKSKTREELLAEERDYKRRRMSYRGKKLKRTTTQVMRDIIEEYMEEIKQAGGIGCFVKGAEKGDMFKSEPFAAHINIGNSDELKRSARGSSEASRGLPHSYRKQSLSNDDVRSRRFEDSSPKDYELQKRDSHGHDDHLEDHRRRISRDRHGEEYYSRSPDRSNSRGWSGERTSRRRERNDEEVTRTKHHENKRVSSNMSKYHDIGSLSSASTSVNDSTMRKDNQDLEFKDRWQRNAYRNHRSDSVIQNTFEDRYDPSKTYDVFEDDVNSGIKYVRSDK